MAKANAMKAFAELNIDGELKLDQATKILYATDASAYREMPLGAVFPKHAEDVGAIVRWADKHEVELIPRTAGTSLAGQVVGKGLVVDVSRHLRAILNVDTKNKSVWVEPGVIRDDLNRYLKNHLLFFGPETSTSNRCMIGGMLGNNACGARSIIYGSVRDQNISVKGFFANGEFAHVKALSPEEFFERIAHPENSRYNAVLAHIHSILSEPDNRALIQNAFPKESIKRRNTGYALDILAKSNIYVSGGPNFNLCHLLAGSEGTLFFSTEIELHCHSLPPKHVALFCIHSHSIDQSLRANIMALNYHPTACELIDHHILDCTKQHPTYKDYRFFVKGDPKALLVVEFAEDDPSKIDEKCVQLEKALIQKNLSYHCSVVRGADIEKVWTLRKAGLGLLANIPGDAKPAPVIEDTAVDAQDLPAFIEAFNKTLHQKNLFCVHYAHAATGELHLRPILNLKSEEGKGLFRSCAEDIAKLVKQYRGSLSGEHGDGRLRGEFIAFMYGDVIYQWFCDVKSAFDPKHIFNPGKITATPPMDTQLRYDGAYHNRESLKTEFDWSQFKGFQRSVELCNGSGDCRKSPESGGVMCPSYMATRDEKHSTRGRANLLRDVLSKKEASVLDHQDVKEALDLCLSCKACKSECPSNVDMAKIKAEYYQAEVKTSLRSRAFGYSSRLHEAFRYFPGIYNWFNTGFNARLNQKILGIHPNRKLPLMQVFKTKKPAVCAQPKSKIILVLDEFSALLNGQMVEDCLTLLHALDVEVVAMPYFNSTRALISKGFVKAAKKQLRQSMQSIAQLDPNIPLVGLEPSAMLGFRDEFPSLFPKESFWQNAGERSFLIEEFLHGYFTDHPESQSLFDKDERIIHYHGHCHQKTLSKNHFALDLLAKPSGHKVVEIKSTCCGMAGSFGYEKEHYDLSKRIAELSLIPAINNAQDTDLISASGFSCQHQIKDFSGRTALHPVQVLALALKHNGTRQT